MTDAQWAKFTGQPQINRAAQRREHAKERAQAIADLGMAPEPEGIGSGHPDAYAATTGELVRWAREKREGK